MGWVLLIILTAGSWYLALTPPGSSYPRDWRLKWLHLSAQEEQDFHVAVRKVVALVSAIVFSVLLVIAVVARLVS